MPRSQNKDPSTKRARAPAGKKQVLVLMDADVIKQTKLAAVEDDRKMSHCVEEAVREWLDRRQRRGD
jgi:hypothetical protein